MPSFGPTPSSSISDTPVVPSRKQTFRFWNLKQPRLDVMASLVRSHRVDVLMLAECHASSAAVLTALNTEAAAYFMVPSLCPKIAIYTRFTEQYLQAIENGRDYVIFSLAIPGRLTILLCVVHFPSKLRQHPVDQTQFTSKFSTDVLARAEEKVQHTRTVLVGDLNMNPYEDGMVVYNGLHAVMTREIAQRGIRIVKFASNRFFYNPMWRQFGETSSGVAGTYYYAAPKARADY